MLNTFGYFLCVLLITTASAAETLRVGDKMKPFSAKDQHGKEFHLAAGIRYVLVSFDMPTGKKANAVLASKGASFLDDFKAAYISNIHGMPAIGRMFALPKMKKYPHRIILADSEDLLRDYPTQKDRITLLGLGENLEIISISYWDPATDLPPELRK